MSETTGVAMRRVLMAGACSAMLAVVAFGPASAADLSVPLERPVVAVCPPPQEVVILYDKDGRPTVPGRTEYYFCVTGTVLRPGDIPPPPEYCCG
jgi:hypothetical protein